MVGEYVEGGRRLRGEAGERAAGEKMLVESCSHCC
jgi:hypothetical protein